jgi:hypothetical protein
VRIRLSIPDHLVTAPAVEAIERGAKWRPEPFLDGEHFDLGHQVTERGWGDCDDLAPYLTGSLIASGEDEGARTRIQKTGPNRYHAVVETSDGRILDPSRWAGMGKRSAPNSPGVVGSTAKPFARPEGGAIAVVPYRGQWWARCDLPWSDANAHIASHARSRDPNVALARAVEGAVDCGEQIESPLLERAMCAGSFLLGDVASVGDDFFEGTFHLKRLAKEWEQEAIAKGYSKENPPPKSGPDSFNQYLLDHGWHKGKSTTFGAALRGASRIVRGVSDTAAPAASILAPGASTMLSALSQGAGLIRPPEGGDIIHSRSGAVSVPLESPDASTPQHMFLYYHPKGNPGPVIMRF